MRMVGGLSITISWRSTHHPPSHCLSREVGRRLRLAPTHLLIACQEKSGDGYVLPPPTFSLLVKRSRTTATSCPHPPSHCLSREVGRRLRLAPTHLLIACQEKSDDGYVLPPPTFSLLVKRSRTTATSCPHPPSHCLSREVGRRLRLAPTHLLIACQEKSDDGYVLPPPTFSLLVKRSRTTATSCPHPPSHCLSREVGRRLRLAPTHLLIACQEKSDDGYVLPPPTFSLLVKRSRTTATSCPHQPSHCLSREVGRRLRLAPTHLLIACQEKSDDGYVLPPPTFSLLVKRSRTTATSCPHPPSHCLSREVGRRLRLAPTHLLITVKRSRTTATSCPHPPSHCLSREVGRRLRLAPTHLLIACQEKSDDGYVLPPPTFSLLVKRSRTTATSCPHPPSHCLSREVGRRLRLAPTHLLIACLEKSDDGYVLPPPTFSLLVKRSRTTATSCPHPPSHIMDYGHFLVLVVVGVVPCSLSVNNLVSFPHVVAELIDLVLDWLCGLHGKRCHWRLLAPNLFLNICDWEFSVHICYHSVYTSVTIQCTHLLPFSVHICHHSVYTSVTIQCTHLLPFSVHICYHSSLQSMFKHIQTSMFIFSLLWHRCKSIHFVIYVYIYICMKQTFRHKYMYIYVIHFALFFILMFIHIGVCTLYIDIYIYVCQ